ncbi:hypothetical protein, conserved [Eimeria necatrix]|uniref:Uncharacterized protein n=1 Tax=Eimeria necatrix TaxID=51315 RepID=U6MS02_9EIME|nr:hypothetical protein, conserved [Eimeria necatrix]CDJ65868.1 hypothetical protein, conserved [Eimeria necatrix]
MLASTLKKLCSRQLFAFCASLGAIGVKIFQKVEAAVLSYSIDFPTSDEAAAQLRDTTKYVGGRRHRASHLMMLSILTAVFAVVFAMMLCYKSIEAQNGGDNYSLLARRLAMGNGGSNSVSLVISAEEACRLAYTAW